MLLLEKVQLSWTNQLHVQKILLVQIYKRPVTNVVRTLIAYATRYLFLVSINLLAYYRECRALIGYATHYLFCNR